MKNIKHCGMILSLAVLGIGAYMTYTYWGKALPPTLSGIAFSLIAIRGLVSKK